MKVATLGPTVPFQGFRACNAVCYKAFHGGGWFDWGWWSAMTDGAIYKQGWTLDDVQWSRFDASKVDPRLLAAAKGAALVEYNAPDYVGYLKRVFEGDDQTIAAIEQWGTEETQHGQALARWCELADPSFNFQDAVRRFREGYKPEHFKGDSNTSLRGSRRGEMISRCVVESGTSSYYSAMRDICEEPVLKEVAGRIAADEFRHYRLFYDTLNAQSEPDLPFWRKLLVAISRVNESDDDELAFSFYCGNVPADQESARPYDRERYVKEASAAAMFSYRRHHITKLTQMVAKAIGADPQGRLIRIAGTLIWRMLSMRAAKAETVAA